MGQQRLRVVVSAGLIGGAGGAERALASTIRALHDDDVTVVVRTMLPGAEEVVHPGLRLGGNMDWRWRGSNSSLGLNGRLARVLNPLRRRLLPGVDVYIRLFQGADLSSVLRARVSLIVPSGNAIAGELAARYDFVAMQAPDNAVLVEAGYAKTLLRPPLYDLSERSEPPAVELPARFLLTVFNPYDPIKGLEDLLATVDELPLPLVWCHSTVSVGFDIPRELAEHPRVVHVESPSAAQLRYLYEHCAAYVCFSRTEGFGWSIADALRYSPAVVSRRLGILSNDEALAPTVHLVGDQWHVDWSTIDLTRARVTRRQLEWHSPEHFRQSLVSLVESRR